MVQFNSKYERKEREKKVLETKKTWADRTIYLLILFLFSLNVFFGTKNTVATPMQQNKYIIKYLIGAIFIIFASVFITQEQYGYAFLLLLALLILPKLDELTDLVFSFKDGLKAKFLTPKEKIEEDIKENNQQVTKSNYIRFQNIESEILHRQQKKYGKEMKTLVNFMYGNPDKPEFMYTPDGSLMTDDALYFFEIKYIIKPEFAEKIVNQTISNLKIIYDKFAPITGKKLVIKLILASSCEINVSQFKTPKNIEIELEKI